MAEIKSESVADFIPESVADFARNTKTLFRSNARQHQRSRYGHREDKGGPQAPRNHFILTSSQQNIIGAEAIADGLTVDDCSKGAAEVAHMITFMALLDHEVISR